MKRKNRPPVIKGRAALEEGRGNALLGSGESRFFKGRRSSLQGKGKRKGEQHI